MHGTSPDGAVGITDGGFRLDLTGSHAGTMFGSLAQGISLWARHPKSLPWNANQDQHSGLYLCVQEDGCDA